ncbi:hypothetical protein Pfo_030992 [Paulownia fortunei]|nr:hypothetical protein Pfo_030992 [Paulownia fortunei]
MIGDLSPDSGDISINGRVIYVPQLVVDDSDRSGGEKMMQRINESLNNQPDILVLDEPTANLDMTHQNWLIKRLSHFYGTLMCDFHDSYFLNHIIQKIWALHEQQVTAYNGNYHDYLAQRNLVNETQNHLYHDAVNKKKQLQRAMDKVRTREKQVTKRPKNISPSDARLISGKGETVKAGNHLLLQDVNFNLETGERLAVLGDNGSGKTTLIKQIIKNYDKPVGYFSQNLSGLDEEKTVLENVLLKSSQLPQLARDFLGKWYQCTTGDCRSARIGMQAYFTYTIVFGFGFNWQQALAIVFLVGVVDIIITLTHGRRAIVKGIPSELKAAIGGGIGMFVTYIGLKNAGFINFIVDPGNILTLNDKPFTGKATVILVMRKVPGAFLITLIATTVIGIPMGVTNTHISAGTSIGSAFGSLGHVFGQALGANDTKAFEEDKGFNSKMDRALVVDTFTTAFAGIAGTSNTTTFIESAAGVAAGARTGLANIVTAVGFALMIIFAPFVGVIPTAATSPLLILVGVMMMGEFTKISWENLEVALPAFFTSVFMAFSYSISYGIAAGFLFFIIVKLTLGTVKIWQKERGYGYITPDDGGDDIFVHFNGIEMDGFKSLIQGEKVKYVLVQGHQKYQAARVQPIRAKAGEI